MKAIEVHVLYKTLCSPQQFCNITHEGFPQTSKHLVIDRHFIGDVRIFYCSSRSKAIGSALLYNSNLE